MYVVTILLSAPLLLLLLLLFTTPVLIYTVDVVSGTLFSSSFMCSHRKTYFILTQAHWTHTHTHSTHCKFKHDSTNRLNPPILWTKRAVSEQKRRTKLQNKQTNIFYFFIITCFGKHLRTNYMLINMWQLIINSNFILW